MKYSPFLVQNPGSPPENVSPPNDVKEAQMLRRAAIFGQPARCGSVSPGR